jgi:outer membrane protein assembly factor BamB
VAGDKLLFGTSNAELIALSLADGSLQWKAVLTSEVLSLPRVRKNMVIVRTSDGRLAGLDLASGGVRWTHERSIPPLSVRGLGSPALTDDLVLDGFGGGKLIALGLLDGKPVWDTTVATPHGRSEVERLVELNADPLIRNDTVYVSGFQAGVSALNLQDGEMLWTQASVYSSHGLSAGRRSLFISDTNSDVWQLDISNGADMWKQSDLHQRRLTIPVPVKNRLVVGDFEGYLHVLSTDDGRLMGRLEVDDTPILAAPVIYNDVIYVYTTGGVLSALGMD